MPLLNSTDFKAVLQQLKSNPGFRVYVGRTEQHRHQVRFAQNCFELRDMHVFEPRLWKFDSASGVVCHLARLYDPGEMRVLDSFGRTLR